MFNGNDMSNVCYEIEQCESKRVYLALMDVSIPDNIQEDVLAEIKLEVKEDTHIFSFFSFSIWHLTKMI